MRMGCDLEDLTGGIRIFMNARIILSSRAGGERVTRDVARSLSLANETFLSCFGDTCPSCSRELAP